MTRSDSRSLCSRLGPAVAFLAVAFILSPWACGQSSSGVTINSSPQLFSVMAALNAAGYNAGINANTGDNTRQEVRGVLAKEKIAILPEIAKFYEAHRISGNPGDDFGQYVSLALLLGPPPHFSYTIPKQDLPPDASDVRGFVPLLRAFYRQADLQDLYARLAPRYLSAIQAYAGTVRSQIQLSDAYLRFPSGSYLGREYHIYVCLLGPPEQVEARIYGERYYLVVTPSVDLRFKEIRHQYLHFLLDPLAVKYAADIHSKAVLQSVVRTAPALGQDFKDDFSLLVTECLIHAVELRMDNPADAQKQIQSDLTSGLILTPYFYTALAAYAKQPSPMSIYYQQMIQGISLKKMEKMLETVKFAPPHAARMVQTTLAVSAKVRLLHQGDNLIYAGHYGRAGQVFQKVLSKYDPRSQRALYGRAVAASNTAEPDIAVKYFKRALTQGRSPYIITWSHIYLGRIYDVEGRRDEALNQYRAASVTASAFPEALAALKSGMQHPFDEP